MINQETRNRIIEFLKTQREELKKNDLNAVYNNLPKKVCRARELSEFFFDSKIDPLKYFKKEIPIEAFFYMNLLYTDLRISQNINIIGDFAFYKSGIEKLYIPSSVNYIGNSAFGYCEDLKEVYIDGCPKLDEDVFIWDVFSWNPNIQQFKMNCSEREFERVNPEQFEDYKYDCGLEIQFLK